MTVKSRQKPHSSLNSSRKGSLPQAALRITRSRRQVRAEPDATIQCNNSALVRVSRRAVASCRLVHWSSLLLFSLKQAVLQNDLRALRDRGCGRNLRVGVVGAVQLWTAVLQELEFGTNSGNILIRE